MSKDDSIIMYLSKITQVRNELGGVGVTVPERDLVSFALLALHKSWNGFQDAVSCRENFPNWERLWIDCVQEEIWRGIRDGRLIKAEDEENFALPSKRSKAKGKEGQGVVESSQKGKKKDLTKIKCFHCHEFGHYATSCLKRKESNRIM